MNTLGQYKKNQVLENARSDIEVQKRVHDALPFLLQYIDGKMLQLSSLECSNSLENYEQVGVATRIMTELKSELQQVISKYEKKIMNPNPSQNARPARPELNRTKRKTQKGN